MTAQEVVVEWPCGCFGLDVQNGDGNYFVLMACREHGADHCHWRDFYGKGRARVVDEGSALLILDGVRTLIRDGWKLRDIQESLPREIRRLLEGIV